MGPPMKKTTCSKSVIHLYVATCAYMYLRIDASDSFGKQIGCDPGVMESERTCMN